MRRLIVVFILLAPLVGAFGAETPKHLKTIEETLGLSEEQLQERNRLVTRIDAIRDKIRTIEEKIEERIAGGTPKDSEGLASARTDIKTYERWNGENQVALDKIKGQIDAGDLAKARSELAQIATLKLDGRVDELKIRVLNIAQRLLAKEREFDQRNEGDYLRSKFARVLSNDKVMCPAISSCMNGDSLSFEKANTLLGASFHNEEGSLGREAGTGKKVDTHVKEEN